MALRHRAATRSRVSEDIAHDGTNAGKEGEKVPEAASSARIPVWAIFAVLLAARVAGAFTTLVPDCDEVFNYWEPLHLLLHGSGKQTWEYSPEFALRSYLYLYLHAPFAMLGSFLAQAGLLPWPHKIAAFYAVRLGLALLSASTDTYLCWAVQRRHGWLLAAPTAMLLAGSSGMVLASTTFLPSSFAMCCMSAATAASFAGHAKVVILAAVVAAVWGWPVAAAAFLPHAVFILHDSFRPAAVPAHRRFAAALATLLAAAAATLVPLALLDVLHYRAAKVSVWSFLQYNVLGGGSSALYGVEPWYFYLRNGLLNFNLMLPLALLSPVVMAAQALRARSRPSAAAWVSASSLAAWWLLISAMPHKEERFLYPLYPCICLLAAWTLQPLLRAAADGRRRPAHRGGAAPALAAAARALAWTALAASLGVSLSRTASQIYYYRAPMALFHQLPQAVAPTPAGRDAVQVCMGKEWYRFCSSFFLPETHRLGFLRSPFRGLLPGDFAEGIGVRSSTSSAPAWMNNRNREALQAYTAWQDCDVLIEYTPPSASCASPQAQQLLQDARDAGETGAPPPSLDDYSCLGAAAWEEVAVLPFVEQARSKWWARVLYLPGVSDRHLAWGRYGLYRRAGA